MAAKWGKHSLRVISWNVRKPPRGELDAFMDTLHGDLSWHILLLQEFSGGSTGRLLELRGGHKLYHNSPQDGRSKVAIVVHRDFEGDIEMSRHRGHSLSLDITWGKKRMRVVTSHLNPYRDMENMKTT